MSFNIVCPSWGVTQHCKMPVILFLYNFLCNTTNAFDLRVILLASTASYGNFLFIMYARYGYIHISSIIMTSSGSDVAPEPAVVVKLFSLFIDLSTISSQNTPNGTGKHCDPIFAKLSASSLLFLLMCETSHPSNVPSR
jgi:hypothetical protein